MMKIQYRYLTAVIVFVVSGLLLYATSLVSFFHADDYWIIQAVENNPFGIWTFGSQFFFRPVISVVTYLDYQIWGMNPFGFHLTNVLFHTSSSLLIAWIMHRITPYMNLPEDQQQLIVLASGLLFLSMPVNVESVTWISGRTDVIAVFFALAALAAYVEYRLQQRSVWWLMAAGIATLLSLFAKEATIGLPVMIVFTEVCLWLARKEPGQRQWRSAALFVGIVPVYLLIRWLALGTLVGGYTDTLSGYKWHLLPNHIYLAALDINFHSEILQSTGTVVPTVVLAVLVIGFVVVNFRRRSHLFVGLLALACFTLALAPAQQLLLKNLDFFPLGDRLTYFASAFMAMLLAFTLTATLRNIYISGLLFCIILGWNSVALYHVNQVWHVAGEQQKQIIADFEALTDPDAPAYIILNAPYMYEYSPMFPGMITMNPALDLHGLKNPQSPALLLSMHWQTALNLSVEVGEYQDDGFFVVPAQDGVLHVTDTPEPAGYRTYIEYVACCQTVVVRLKPAAEELPVLYYSDGRLHRLQ